MTTQEEIFGHLCCYSQEEFDVWLKNEKRESFTDGIKAAQEIIEREVSVSLATELLDEAIESWSRVLKVPVVRGEDFEL